MIGYDSWMASHPELEITPAGPRTSSYALSGEIDLHTASRISEIPIPEGGPEARVFLDFSSVSFVDSIGIWALVNLSRALEGGKLVITHAPDNVRRTLDLVDVSDATAIVVED